MEVRSFQDLLVWQKAMSLVESCYKATETFPRHQLFGLTNQLQRAAVSIPANIAEGYGRRSTGDYLRYLSIAYGSLSELETHIQIACRLNYTEAQEATELLAATAEVGKMLNGLIASLKRAKM